MRVAANNSIDAAAIAEAAFEHGQVSGPAGPKVTPEHMPDVEWGYTTSWIREDEVIVRQDK